MAGFLKTDKRRWHKMYSQEQVMIMICHFVSVQRNSMPLQIPELHTHIEQVGSAIFWYNGRG